MLKQLSNNLDLYFALALAIVIPNFQILIPIVIGLWVLTLFFRTKSLSFNFSWQAAAMLAFFAINLIGMMYTFPENIGRGWLDLEIKLSFLLFPIVFFLIPEFSVSKKQQVVKWFIISVFISIIWHYLRSVFQYYNGENVYTFYGKNFTKPFHIGYYSMYINFAFVALLTHKSSFLKNNNILYGLAFTVLTIGQFFTTSKIGIVTFCLLVLVYFISQVFRSGFKGYHAALLVVLIVIGGFFANSKTGLRFKLAYNQFFETELSSTAEGSTQARVFALKTVGKIIKDHWLIGVGTGDIDVETLERYEKYGYTGALKRKLNAHNQFLQTFATLGLFGFISVLMVYLLMVLKSIKFKDGLLFGFAIITLVFALTESMLETQAGIVFFTFFSLILSQNNSDYDSIFTS